MRLFYRMNKRLLYKWKKHFLFFVGKDLLLRKNKLSLSSLIEKIILYYPIEWFPIQSLIMFLTHQKMSITLEKVNTLPINVFEPYFVTK